jgi:hypothetical protein
MIPESHAGSSVCYWQGLPCQTGQGWWLRQKGIPGPPGWGLGLRLTTPPHKNYCYKTSRGGQGPPRAVEPMMMMMMISVEDYIQWCFNSFYLRRKWISVRVLAIFCECLWWPLFPQTNWKTSRKIYTGIERNSKIQNSLQFKSYFSLCVDLKRILCTHVTTNVPTTFQLSLTVCSCGTIFLHTKLCKCYY